MPKTPTDYSKTIIYKIQHIDNPELLYIGSTIDFTKRKGRHKSTCNNSNIRGYNYKLYQMIRDNGGWDMFNMIELYKFKCNNKREAECEEDKCIREMKSSLNMIRAFVSPEEKQEHKKQYYTEHKEQIAEQTKQYRLEHKEQIAERRKQYYTEHKDEILERKKQYYTEHKEQIAEQTKQYYTEHKEQIAEHRKQWALENKDKIAEYMKQWALENKDKIAERDKQKITCDCGCVITKSNLPKHKRTKKHQDLINKLVEN